MKIVNKSRVMKHFSSNDQYSLKNTSSFIEEQKKENEILKKKIKKKLFFL